MTKKLLITLSILTLFASCGTRRCPTTFDEGVVINGIRWATRNVDAPGIFAQNPESAGGFFTFAEAQNACPQDWRLPTREELQFLVNADSGWTIKNGVNGRLFGSGRNQLFLSAAGYRSMPVGGRLGRLNHVGASGNYWGSSTSDRVNNSGSFLWFYGGSSKVIYAYRGFGHSVRCVAK